MKICDKCGQADEKHKEVGPVAISVTGYHYNHHTHKNVPWQWHADLCPKCAGLLKCSIADLIPSRRTGPA